MTITELIAQLESLKVQHGDVACVVRHSEYRRQPVRTIRHMDSRPSPWKSRDQPRIEIVS